MKKIIRIARLELSTLFYSPIAWFLLIVLLIQVGLTYTEIMSQYEQSRQIYNGFGFLSSSIFSSGYSVLSNILGKLYLYIPLITMGLMSRETSSGTIKLLYSSPVTVSEIIFGKFAAMMTYCMLLIGALALFMIAGAITIPHFEYKLMISGLLGIYLLLCTYSAIGLFMSCLTSYQVVAAISTFVIFAFLSYVGDLWQNIDFVRDITWSLSMTGRTEKMISGLITTKDLAYFAVIMYIFLGLAIFKLRSARESKPLVVRIGRYVLVVVSAVTIGYLTSRPGFIGYYDATATKTNTLSPNAQQIVKEMGDAPIEVIQYDNFLDRNYYYGEPSARNANVARWEPYVRFKSNISFKYVYYYDSVADPNFYKYLGGKSQQDIVNLRMKAMKVDPRNFLKPKQIRSLIDLRPEQNRLVMQLRYKDKTTFLRTFNDMQVWPSETEICAAFKRMMMPRLPKILFLQGAYERSIDKSGDRDYQFLTNQKAFRYALINQGFDVDTLSAAGRDIPTDIAALVIADPKIEFSAPELERIQKYIDAGGNLLIAGEPGKQAVLNPILKGLGVQILDGTLIQKSRDYSPDLALPYLTAHAGSLSKTLANDFEDSAQVSMPGAAALSFDSNGLYKIQPLLLTDQKTSWNKKGKFVTDSAEVGFSSAEGDEKKAFPTALSLTRKTGGKEQRIVVTGDADFISNAELSRRNVRTANFHFTIGIFGWFSYDEFPIDTSRPHSKDNRLRLSEAGLLALKIIFLGLVPGFCLILGAILLIRRKRK
jgi:ABC-2 type transport system permease protein